VSCRRAEPAAVAAPATGDTTEFDSSRGTINLDQPAAKAAPERAQIGNPLWAIPLGSLGVTRDRPLFTPSRRPPAPAVVAVPVIPPPKVALPPPEPEHPSLVLIGTVVGENEGVGVFLDQATHDFVRMKTGEGHAGWILRSVKAREVTLEKGAKSETLRLPARMDSSAPAPAGPRPGDPL
jgi:general secretion pathway protein N